MEQKNLIIICITAIICVAILSTTLILLNTSDNALSKNNTTVENDTLTPSNETNTTVNTTDNATQKSSSKKSGTKKTSKKSGSSSKDTINGEKVVERHNFAGDPNVEYIGTKNNIYLKDKTTGKTYKRHLDDDGVYRYY